MIAAHDIVVSYGTTRVLDRVSFAADSQQVVGLIGPNGSGKTTVLKTMYGALKPDHGRVEIDGVGVGRLSSLDLARRAAVVPQETPPELPLTVADMTLLGRAPHRSMFQAYTAGDHAIAAAALRRVGARQLAERPFTTLSGGERQRVLIARALTQQSDHLLLDEPTNHLDIHYQHEILVLVRELAMTTVVVLHDLNLAARYCDRVVLLDGGRVVGAGTPADVLQPHILEPVYRLQIERITRPDGVQLLFRPHPDADTTHRIAATPTTDSATHTA